MAAHGPPMATTGKQSTTFKTFPTSGVRWSIPQISETIDLFVRKNSVIKIPEKSDLVYIFVRLKLL